jgi:hypothetical protein
LNESGRFLRSDFEFVGPLFGRLRTSGQETLVALLLTITCAVLSWPLSAAGGEKSTNNRSQFNLQCDETVQMYKLDKTPFGDPSRVQWVYSLDLAKQEFMDRTHWMDNTDLGPFRIQKVSPNIITLFDGLQSFIDTPVKHHIVILINRLNGEQSYSRVKIDTDGSSYLLEAGSGKCSKAPFTPFPKAQF